MLQPAHQFPWGFGGQPLDDVILLGALNLRSRMNGLALSQENKGMEARLVQRVVESSLQAAHEDCNGEVGVWLACHSIKHIARRSAPELLHQLPLLVVVECADLQNLGAWNHTNHASPKLRAMPSSWNQRVLPSWLE